MTDELRQQLHREYKIKERDVVEKLGLKGWVKSAEYTKENQGTITFRTSEVIHDE